MKISQLWIKKSYSAALVIFLLTCAQANARADEILVYAAASLTDVLRRSLPGTSRNPSIRSSSISARPAAWRGKSTKARRRTSFFPRTRPRWRPCSRVIS